MIEYSQSVLQHFSYPSNVGELENSPETVVVTAEVGTVADGTVIRLFIAVRQQVIMQAKFKAYGCVATIACCSLLTELIMGKSLKQLNFAVSETLMQKLLLPPEKQHCAIVAERVLTQALQALESFDKKR